MKDKKLSKRKYKIRSKKQKHSRKRTQKKNKRSLKRKNTNRRTRRRNTRRNTRRNIHGGRNPFLKRERKKVEKIKKAEKAAELKKRREKRRQMREESRWDPLATPPELGEFVAPLILEEKRKEKKRMDKQQEELVKEMDRMGKEQKRIGYIMGGIDMRDSFDSEGTLGLSEGDLDLLEKSTSHNVQGTPELSEEELKKRIHNEHVKISRSYESPDWDVRKNHIIQPFIIEGEDGRLRRVNPRTGSLELHTPDNHNFSVKTKKWNTHGNTSY